MNIIKSRHQFLKYETYYLMYTNSIKKAFEENKKEFEICKWNNKSSVGSQNGSVFLFGCT